MSATTSARRATSRIARMRNDYICPNCQLKQLRLSTLNDGYSSSYWRSQARLAQSQSQLQSYSRSQTRSYASSSVRSFSRSSTHSTDASVPPLLSKFKTDLKTAMRAKDTPRLNVLRAMISEYNNSTKTSSPIKTDLQLLALLRKKKASSEMAVNEARDANRDDLVQKQEAEMAVMDEYAGSVEVMGEEDVERVVGEVVEAMKRQGDGDIKAGSVLKELFKTDGVLEGKPVEKSLVAKIVNRALSGEGVLKRDENVKNSVPA